MKTRGLRRRHGRVRFDEFHEGGVAHSLVPVFIGPQTDDGVAPARLASPIHQPVLVYGFRFDQLSEHRLLSEGFGGLVLDPVEQVDQAVDAFHHASRNGLASSDVRHGVQDVLFLLSEQDPVDSEVDDRAAGIVAPLKSARSSLAFLGRVLLLL